MFSTFRAWRAHRQRRRSRRNAPQWRLRARPQFARLQLELLEPRTLLAGTPIITEFLASNDEGLRDGDGNASD